MQKRASFKEVIGFDDRWLIIFGLPAAAILISLLLFHQAAIEGMWSYYLICIPISFLYTGIYWFMLRRAYCRLKQRYPGVHELKTRLLYLLPFFFLIYAGVKAIDKLFVEPFYKSSFEPNLLVEIIATFILSAFIMTLYEAISFYIELQKTLTEKVELERKNVASQLEGLRNQVNPHFLFNSLNTLIYLIPETPDKAVRFVQQLSKVYRYVLESREDKIISLQTELTFLQAYNFLLKERFGHNLNIDVRPSDHWKNAAIVPLTLQMLVENAIKHNVISTEKPLNIEIFSENGHLIVRNNLQIKNQVMDSTGVGLDNIRSRYQILTNQTVEAIVSPQYFTVVLPLISVDLLYHEPEPATATTASLALSA